MPCSIRNVRLLWELSKAPVTLLVVFTAGVGFVLGSTGQVDLARCLWTLAGVMLTAGGANAFNEWVERGLDAKMQRTRRRPLPSGRMRPSSAWMAAWVLTIGGAVVLFSVSSTAAALLALSNSALYVLVYTPLKRKTSLCTLVGAAVGSVPPMIGWAAASRGLDAGAWVLAAVLFTWQIPHFLSLAWIHREDYARAGFRMLPNAESGERLTFLLILLYSLALMPVGLSAVWFGVAGAMYAVGSVLLGTLMALLGVLLIWRKTPAVARQLFVGSLIYLPALLGLMMVDRHMPSSARYDASAVAQLDFG